MQDRASRVRRGLQRVDTRIAGLPFAGRNRSRGGREYQDRRSGIPARPGKGFGISVLPFNPFGGCGKLRNGKPCDDSARSSRRLQEQRMPLPQATLSLARLRPSRRINCADTTSRGGNEAALRTAVYPDGQRLADFQATQAMLARSGRVHFHHSPPSLCRFGGEFFQEGTPWLAKAVSCQTVPLLLRMPRP